MPILDIKLWSAPPLAEAFERLEAQRNSDQSKPTAWEPGSSLSPADAFCYLKARFGEPNGPMMLVVPPSSDNIIHWHYTLVSGGDTLHIQSISSRVEFMAFSKARLSDDDWREFIRQLKEDFSRFGKEMKSVRDKLERWTIFVNPYFRFERIVAELHGRLEDLKIKTLDFPEFPRSEEDFASFHKRLDRLIRKYSTAAELGATLRMVTPVWGESFINLVIFLLAKEDLRADNRLYEDLLRKQIDLRISLLHMHCDGFQFPVDRNAEPVRNFLTVMNHRNDFLHGNVDPKKLAVGNVYFEGKMPIFTRYQTFTERSLAPQLKYIEPETAKKDIYQVEEFIFYVLQQLEPPRRKAVKLFMETALPGCILFSDVVADFVAPEVWDRSGGSQGPKLRKGARGSRAKKSKAKPSGE